MGLILGRPATTTAQTFAVEFDGTEDVAYDRLTTDLSGSAANIGGEDFTWECWLKPTSSNSNTGTAFSDAHIWADRDLLDAGSVGGEYIWSILNNRLHLSISPGTASGVYDEFEATTSINDGAWHFIVIQYDFSTGGIQAWVDGTREINGTASSSGTLAWTSGTAGADDILELGGEKHEQSAGANLTYFGRMSDTRISNTLRYSTTEISVPTSPMTADGDTIILWSFSEGTGTTVADSVSSADLTLQLNGGAAPPRWVVDSPY